ncbi:hypothetical protein N752_11370 [Desulforamulus aquiferis]|nr:hypothetical protein N752_11370 [Desulforamulus aquiferis]
MDKTSSGGSVAIQMDGLTKKFGNYRAVSDLSLDVSSGEIFGFLGLNGAGKSTTIKMMLSLLKPSSGSIYMLGNKLTPEVTSYGRKLAIWRKLLIIQGLMW